MAGASLAVFVSASANTSRADSGEASYGRVAGDVTLVGGIGAAVASSGPRAAAELRARYLETAGVFATYEDGVLVDSSSAPRRVLTFGLELRPLFLYRWLKGYETRRARLDLAIDSFGLELGMTWPQPAPDSGLASHPGIEAGLGIELPLMPDATGLWLSFHGGIRWSDDASAAGLVHPTDREAYLAITLAWHEVVSTHLVDAGDRAPR